MKHTQWKRYKLWYCLRGPGGLALRLGGWKTPNSDSSVDALGAELLNWCIRLPGTRTHCPSLIRPPSSFAGPARHPRFVCHFSKLSTRFCMGNQKNRLTATKTLNHLVRLFYKWCSDYSPERDLKMYILSSSGRALWKAGEWFEGFSRVGKILTYPRVLPYTTKTETCLQRRGEQPRKGEHPLWKPQTRLQVVCTLKKCVEDEGRWKSNMKNNGKGMPKDWCSSHEEAHHNSAQKYFGGCALRYSGCAP